MNKKRTPESIPQKEVVPAQNESKTRPFESLRDLIGLISAGAGVFAALLYLAGRSFAGGYFSAMNIPSYQVSFSLWEYGEVAWIPLLLYPVGMMALTSFLSGVFSRILDWLSPLIVRFIYWLKTIITIKLPSIHLPESSRLTKFWFATARNSFFILLLMALVIFTLQFVSEFGKLNGQIHILENSAQVELISAIPMALDDNQLSATQASRQDYYIYKGLHLLTVNAGKYYLFKEIDPATCKPLKVYVINADQDLQLNLLPTKSLAGQCHQDTSPQVTATPVSTQPTP